MTQRSFKDRFLTPRVSRAMMSSRGILLFGAATAISIVVGVPIALSFVLGLMAWAVNVAVAIPRNPATPKIEPSRLSEPWRGYVMSAQQASAQFDRLVDEMSPGPLRDRLASMSQRMDDGVVESWSVARRGEEVAKAQLRIPADSARQQLAHLQHQAATQPGGPPPAMQQTMASLQAQIDSSNRLGAVAADAQTRLRLLDARFDELVARAVEVSVGSGDTDLLGNDVEGVVDELEALRLALEETDPRSTPAIG